MSTLKSVVLGTPLYLWDQGPRYVGVATGDGASGAYRRADFLTMLQDELHVRLVPADTIVIDASDIEIHDDPTSGLVTAGQSAWGYFEYDGLDPEVLRREAAERIALAAHLEAEANTERGKASAEIAKRIGTSPRSARRLYDAGLRAVTE